MKLRSGIEHCTAYIGTYTSGKSEGIYAIDLDNKTGKPSYPLRYPDPSGKAPVCS